LVKRLVSKVKRVSLVLGITYFAIATYGGSYYVAPAMVLALSWWLYQECKLARLLKEIDES